MRADTRAPSALRPGPSPVTSSAVPPPKTSSKHHLEDRESGPRKPSTPSWNRAATDLLSSGTFRHLGDCEVSSDNWREAAIVAVLPMSSRREFPSWPGRPPLSSRAPRVSADLVPCREFPLTSHQDFDDYTQSYIYSHDAGQTLG
jgi:hypothetical protein